VLPPAEPRVLQDGRQGFGEQRARVVEEAAPGVAGADELLGLDGVFDALLRRRRPDILRHPGRSGQGAARGNALPDFPLVDLEYTITTQAKPQVLSASCPYQPVVELAMA
jgi:hypothetical protein